MVNVHTVKPLDRVAVRAAVKDIGVIVTAEEHQVGGFGSIIARAACEEKDFSEPLKIAMVGVQDQFGCSGSPWQLVREYGLSAETIARRGLDLKKGKA